MNILIIEDDPMVAMIHREFYKRISEKDELYHAKSLVEARKYLEQEHIDLILLDNYLPDGKGVHLLEEVGDVPVIMITAANDVESVRKALTSGVIDYLIKPFTFERFEQSIVRYKEFKKILHKEHVSQEEIDDYFVYNQVDKEVDYLPKGLTRITLKKIVSTMLTHPQAFTTQDIADEMDISRITIKKYLNFLTSSGFLHEDAEYLTLGRPASLYTINDKKVLSEWVERQVTL